MASESKGFTRLKKLSKEIPPEQDVLKLLRSLTSIDHHAADRAAAIVGGTLLEAALGTAIESKFVPLDRKTERPMLFDGEKNGPISTFSSRIRIGYALGLYGPETQEELECIKAVRNAFAHGAMRLKFQTPQISDICAQLTLFEKSSISEALWGSTPKDRYISTVAFIASRLKTNLSKRPARTILEWATVMHQWGQLT